MGLGGSRGSRGWRWLAGLDRGKEAGWWKDPEGDLEEWRRRLGGWDISPQI